MGSSVLEPEQQHFTFANPASGTCHDALDFDYESWIEQSKSSCSSIQGDQWMDAEAIKRHHQEMMHRLVTGLPEEAYEVSLRDLTELPKPRAMDKATGCREKGTLGNTWSSKSWRKRLSRTRSETMEGAGLIVKMFMRSASDGAGGRKKKRAVAAIQKKCVSANEDGDGSMTNTAAETGNEHNNTQSKSMQNKGHKGRSYRRKSMGCYPFFNSSRRQVKLIVDKE